MKRFIFLFIFSLLLVKLSSSQTEVPVPLYTDPAFKGAADAEVIYNDLEKEWYFFYTNRRSVCEGAPLPALSIGVAKSKDMVHWKHKGYIKVDGIGGEAVGPDILWAPGIVKDGSEYHMFLTFKKGNGRGGRWGAPESLILHLTAQETDLLNSWQTKDILNVPMTSIDATIIKHRGTWNIFHRDITPGQKGVNTYRITTDDLNKPCKDWNYLGAAKGDVNKKEVHGFNYQEAQYVFYWNDYYWLLTDPANGFLTAYRSTDLEEWALVGPLYEEKNAEAETQKGWARHPSVAIIGNKAFIFYFCQPYREQKENQESEACFIQMSELKYNDGKIWFERNAKTIVPNELAPTNNNWGFIGLE